MAEPFDRALSPNVTLHCSRLEAASGIRGILVEYSLSVTGGRQVVFDVDFQGSENVVLKCGSNNLKGPGSVKAKVGDGESRKVIALLKVVDAQKSWTVDMKYTWTERQSISKEISRNIFLETVDVWNKGRTLMAIEYYLSVKKDRRVTFDIDFSGSQNLELVSGGLKKREVVLPNDRLQVAHLQVIDPAKVSI